MNPIHKLRLSKGFTRNEALQNFSYPHPIGANRPIINAPISKITLVKYERGERPMTKEFIKAFTEHLNNLKRSDLKPKKKGGRPAVKENHAFYKNYTGEKCHYPLFCTRLIQGMDKEQAILPRLYKRGRKSSKSFVD